MRGWLRVNTDGVRTRRQLVPWVRRGIDYTRSPPPKPAEGNRGCSLPRSLSQHQKVLDVRTLVDVLRRAHTCPPLPRFPHDLDCMSEGRLERLQSYDQRIRESR
jgi:hypothetical protein